MMSVDRRISPADAAALAYLQELANEHIPLEQALEEDRQRLTRIEQRSIHDAAFRQSPLAGGDLLVTRNGTANVAAHNHGE